LAATAWCKAALLGEEVAWQHLFSGGSSLPAAADHVGDANAVEAVGTVGADAALVPTAPHSLDPSSPASSPAPTSSPAPPERLPAIARVPMPAGSGGAETGFFGGWSHPAAAAAASPEDGPVLSSDEAGSLGSSIPPSGHSPGAPAALINARTPRAAAAAPVPAGRMSSQPDTFSAIGARTADVAVAGMVERLDHAPRGSATAPQAGPAGQARQAVPGEKSCS